MDKLSIKKICQRLITFCVTVSFPFQTNWLFSYANVIHIYILKARSIDLFLVFIGQKNLLSYTIVCHLWSNWTNTVFEYD